MGWLTTCWKTSSDNESDLDESFGIEMYEHPADSSSDGSYEPPSPTIVELHDSVFGVGASPAFPC